MTTETFNKAIEILKKISGLERQLSLYQDYKNIENSKKFIHWLNGSIKDAKRQIELLNKEFENL